MEPGDVLVVQAFGDPYTACMGDILTTYFKGRGRVGIVVDGCIRNSGEVYDAFAQTRPEGVCHLAANPSPSGFPRQQRELAEAVPGPAGSRAAARSHAARSRTSTIRSGYTLGGRRYPVGRGVRTPRIGFYSERSLTRSPTRSKVRA